MKRAVSWCVLVLLSWVGLVACGTGPAGPSPSPPRTTPASATASPSPSAVAKPVYRPATATSKALNVPVPAMPKAAKKETPEGAKAFVRYWVNLMSYIYETGDSRPLDGLWSSSCVVCRTIPESLTNVYATGWIIGGKLRAPSIEVRSTVVKDQMILVAQVIQAELKVRRQDGSMKSYASTNDGYTYTLVWQSNRWVVSDSKQIVP